MLRNIFTTPLPFVHGYCRVSEPTAYLADSMIFELLVCFVLFWISRSVLVVRLGKRKTTLQQAEQLYNELVEEMDDPEQTKYLQRCLNFAESAFNEYDGLMYKVNSLSKVPTHKICRKIIPSWKEEKGESAECFNDLVPPSVRLATSDLLLEPEDVDNARQIDCEIRMFRDALEFKEFDM